MAIWSSNKKPLVQRAAGDSSAAAVRLQSSVGWPRWLLVFPRRAILAALFLLVCWSASLSAVQTSFLSDKAKAGALRVSFLKSGRGSRLRRPSLGGFLSKGRSNLSFVSRSVISRESEQTLWACKPKLKKEKALRNFRTSRQKAELNAKLAEEARLRKQLMRAVEHLELGVLNSEEETKKLETNESRAGFSTVRGIKIPLSKQDAQKSAELRLKPETAETYQLAKINYTLVGGSWRRARGGERFVTLPNAAFVHSVFGCLAEDTEVDDSSDVPSGAALYQKLISMAKKTDLGIVTVDDLDDDEEEEDSLTDVEETNALGKRGAQRQTRG